MTPRWVDISTSDGGRFKGYLAIPVVGTGPGMLLLQEIFGVNRPMREIADYYIFRAPELFWRIAPEIELGYSEADLQKAMSYLQRFDVDQSINDCSDALDQDSVLVQVGLLDPGQSPVAGVETAKRLVDEKLPSNTLMKRWAESAVL